MLADAIVEGRYAADAASPVAFHDAVNLAGTTGTTGATGRRSGAEVRAAARKWEFKGGGLRRGDGGALDAEDGQAGGGADGDAVDDAHTDGEQPDWAARSAKDEAASMKSARAAAWAVEAAEATGLGRLGRVLAASFTILVRPARTSIGWLGVVSAIMCILFCILVNCARVVRLLRSCAFAASHAASILILPLSLPPPPSFGCAQESGIASISSPAADGASVDAVAASGGWASMPASVRTAAVLPFTSSVTFAEPERLLNIRIEYICCVTTLVTIHAYGIPLAVVTTPLT